MTAPRTTQTPTGPRRRDQHESRPRHAAAARLRPGLCRAALPLALGLLLTTRIAAAQVQHAHSRTTVSPGASPTTSAATGSVLGYAPQEWTARPASAPVVRQVVRETTSEDSGPTELPPLRPVPSDKPFLSLGDSDVSPESGVTGRSQESDSELLLQTAIWTVVVLCLCVLTILGVRRWQRARGWVPDKRGTGRVLETLTLGPGRSVSLIQMQGLRALVGCDATGIRTIAVAGPDFSDELHAVMHDDSAPVDGLREAVAAESSD